MKPLLEKEQTISDARIEKLEMEIAIMQEHITQMADVLKEVQKYVIALAKNQAEITKRVSGWPFIPVPMKEDNDNY